MFLKWLFTGRCAECNEELVERSETFSDECSEWVDRIFECVNGHQLRQTGRTQEFR